MKFKMNIDLNIKNQKWSSVEKHINRQHEFYRNKNIQHDLSKNNINLSSNNNANKIINMHYQKYIYKHDLLIKIGKSRAKPYKSVKNYLKRRRACPESTWVIKFGSKDSNKELLSQLIKITGNKKIAIKLKTEADNLGLAYYAKNFNKRNGKFLRWTDAETNVDESSPHIHARIVPLGFSKSKRFGKTPSASIGRALEQRFHDRNNRVAMHHLHQAEDPILIHDMGKAYSKIFGMKFQFQLSRNHNGYSGLGEKQFEILQHKEDKVKKDQSRAKEALIDTNIKLSKQNNKLKKEFRILLISFLQQRKKFRELNTEFKELSNIL